MSDHDRIIAKVTARVSDRSRRTDMDTPPTPVPLAGADLLARVERELGFSLPTLLKRLYLEVGDGGFGPGYGLFGAVSGHWMADEPSTLGYLYSSSHTADWPDGLVPICDWGCAVWSCVDCSQNDFPMVLSDPNFADEEAVIDRHAFFREWITFDAWIEAWADGVDLWERWSSLPRRDL